MSDDMEQMKTDISEIKAATLAMRAETLAMQAEAKAHRADTKSLQEMHYRTMTTVAKMTGDIAEIKRDMATKADIGRLTGQIGGLAAKVDQRLDCAKHEVRLDDYGKRLSRLEDGRA